MKKEEPEEKPEPMEVEEKKPDMKTEPKEEEEGGANSTTSSSPLQSRRKSECYACGCINSVINSSFLRSYSPDMSQCTITYAFIVFCIIVFKPEELRQALMPTLESLYRQDPESLPFRQPVDPMLLGIPVSNTPASIALNSNKIVVNAHNAGDR